MSSITRQSPRNSIFPQRLTACRVTNSSRGREADSQLTPNSRCGYGSKPGRSIRTLAFVSRTAPACSRSASMPGTSSLSAPRPPARRAWTCRPWGMPGRAAASDGKASRSRIVTFAKCDASALAAAKPPIPAPTTTACCPINPDISSPPILLLRPTVAMRGDLLATSFRCKRYQGPDERALPAAYICVIGRLFLVSEPADARRPRPLKGLAACVTSLRTACLTPTDEN